MICVKCLKDFNKINVVLVHSDVDQSDVDQGSFCNCVKQFFICDDCRESEELL